MDVCCDALLNTIVSFTGFDAGLRGTTKRLYYLHDMAFPLPPLTTVDQLVVSVVRGVLKTGCVEQVCVFTKQNNALWTFPPGSVVKTIADLFVGKIHRLHRFLNGRRIYSHTTMLYHLVTGYLLNSANDLYGTNTSILDHLYRPSFQQYIALTHHEKVIRRYFGDFGNPDVNAPDNIEMVLLRVLDDIEQLTHYHYEPTGLREVDTPPISPQSEYDFMQFAMKLLAPDMHSMPPTWMLFFQERFFSYIYRVKCSNCLHATLSYYIVSPSALWWNSEETWNGIFCMRCWSKAVQKQ